MIADENGGGVGSYCLLCISSLSLSSDERPLFDPDCENFETDDEELVRVVTMIDGATLELMDRGENELLVVVWMNRRFLDQKRIILFPDRAYF